MEESSPLGALIEPPIGSRVEIYRRRSERLRSGVASDRATSESNVGSEQGVAVRVELADGRIGFGACSGDGDRSLVVALGDAVVAASPPSSPPPAWESGRAARRSDRMVWEPFPDRDRLGKWLDGALDREGSETNPGERPTAVRVETAWTVETLVADGGPEAERSRQRAWAIAWFDRPHGSGAREVVRTTAALRLDDLDPNWWIDPIERLAPPNRGPGRDGGAVVIAPEGAAMLAGAITQMLHGDPRAIGLGVGPGWCVTEDPLAPSALFGGLFDDAGFPTGRTELADGRQVVGTIGCQGWLRRGSYREPPVATPNNLLLTPLRIAPPDGATWVETIRIHPLGGGEWILEIEPWPAGKKEPATRFHRTRPLELARRCVGGVGEPRQTMRGVRTPALVFDGLGEAR